MQRFLILVALFWSACAWSELTLAQEPKVLVVHSYHQGFFWTDSIQRGIDQQLDDREMDMRVLYLDSKRNQSQQFFTQLESLYRTKLSDERFDAILVTDNNALELMQHLAPLIKDTPVIFCGINNYHPSFHQSLNATGVIENVDLEANLALIERLHPDNKQIYIISDHSVTGAILRDEIDDFIQQHDRYRNKITQLVPDNVEALKQKSLNSIKKMWCCFGLTTATKMAWSAANVTGFRSTRPPTRHCLWYTT